MCVSKGFQNKIRRFVVFNGLFFDLVYPIKSDSFYSNIQLRFFGKSRTLEFSFFSRRRIFTTATLKSFNLFWETPYEKNHFSS